MYLRGLRAMGDGEDFSDVDLPAPDIGANLTDVSSGDFWEMINPDYNGSPADTYQPFYASPDYAPAVDQLNTEAQSRLPADGRFPPANNGGASNPIGSIFNAVGSFFTGKAQAQATAARSTAPYGFIQRPPLLTTPGVYSPFSPGATGATLSTPLVLGGIALAAFLLMRD